ncbi:MAG: hypothetical protein K2W96_06730, partial [Gemmataceae bacterium]|nr:hypothetical protein [Gemmataceae bacterium]
ELDWERECGAGAACFSPAGDLLAVGGDELSIFSEGGERLKADPLPEDWPQAEHAALRFADRGRILAGFVRSFSRPEADRCALVLWHREGDHWTLQRLERLPAAQFGVFSRDGAWLATVGAEPGVRLHEMLAGRSSPLLARSTSGLGAFRFLPDGETAVAQVGDERFFIPWRLLLR